MTGWGHPETTRSRRGRSVDLAAAGRLYPTALSTRHGRGLASSLGENRSATTTHPSTGPTGISVHPPAGDLSGSCAETHQTRTGSTIRTAQSGTHTRALLPTLVHSRDVVGPYPTATRRGVDRGPGDTQSSMTVDAKQLADVVRTTTASARNHVQSALGKDAAEALERGLASTSDPFRHSEAGKLLDHEPKRRCRRPTDRPVEGSR